MGSSAWLATMLDEQMLEKRVQVPTVPLEHLPRRSGAEVAKELGGRWLLRYVPSAQVHEPRSGRYGVATFVTPTPYATSELAHWLDLPQPELPRNYVVRLDPSQVPVIVGPQYVGAGMGIQYVLPEGYGPEAVVHPGWAHEVR